MDNEETSYFKLRVEQSLQTGIKLSSQCQPVSSAATAVVTVEVIEKSHLPSEKVRPNDPHCEAAPTNVDLSLLTVSTMIPMSARDHRHEFDLSFIRASDTS